MNKNSTTNAANPIDVLKRKHFLEQLLHVSASVLLGLIDAATTYLVMTTALSGRDALSTYILTFGVPLLIAFGAFISGWQFRLLLSYGGAKRVFHMIAFIVSLSGFIAGFVAMSVLRAVTPVIDTSGMSTLAGSTTASASSHAFSWLLIAVVFMISAIEFVLGLHFTDPLKTARYHAQLTMEEAKAVFLHDKGVVAELEYDGLSPEEICNADDDAYNAACKQVKARARAYKALVRSTIATKSGNPGIASAALSKPVTQPVALLTEGTH